jgi:hypothetical protein
MFLERPSIAAPATDSGLVAPDAMRFTAAEILFRRAGGRSMKMCLARRRATAQTIAAFGRFAPSGTIGSHDLNGVIRRQFSGRKRS